MNESSIYFFPGGGHDHDGENSSLIDTNVYSIFDFGWEIFGDPNRQNRQTLNYNGFRQFVVDTVNQSIIQPAGVVFQEGVINGNAHIITGSITSNEIAANTITANNILAGTITANLLSANIVLVDQIIASNNYVQGVSGWKIDGDGTAEFDSASIRGAISAAAVVIDANNAWDNTGFILGGNTGIYTSNGVVRIGTSVVIEGAIVADEIVIDANNAWDNTGFILGGNTGIYTSSGVVHIGTSVVIEGTIVADSVDTPGVTIYSNGLLVTANLAIHPDGSISTASQKFYVNANGVLFANDAVITGSIQAGSLAINNNNFWNANGTMKVGSNSQYLVFDGSNVAVTGTVYADSGEIGNWSIDATSFSSADQTVFLYSDGAGSSIVVGTGVSDQIVLGSDGDLYSVRNSVETTINGVADAYYSIQVTDSSTPYTTKISPQLISSVYGGSFSFLAYNEIYSTGAITMGTGNVNGIGIAYPGCTTGPGSPNYMGLVWDLPDIRGTVDNAVSAVLGTVSDIRFKTDISNIEDGYVDKILNDINIIQYTPVDKLNNDRLGDTRRTGIIAQEIVDIFPDLIDGDYNNPDAYLSVNYAGFVPYLIKTIQYLNDKIKKLEENQK